MRRTKRYGSLFGMDAEAWILTICAGVGLVSGLLTMLSEG